MSGAPRAGAPLFAFHSARSGQGFRTTQTSARGSWSPPAPTTRRVPSARTPLTANAHPPPVTGSWRMPSVSDQKKAVPCSAANVLKPRPPLPAALIPTRRGAASPQRRGARASRPRRTRSFPRLQVVPSAEKPSRTQRGRHHCSPPRHCTLAADRAVGSAHAPFTRVQRTGTGRFALPPMTLPSPFAASRSPASCDE